MIQLLSGTWDLPGLVIKPMSPPLAGGFLTTGPREKPFCCDLGHKPALTLHADILAFASCSAHCVMLPSPTPLSLQKDDDIEEGDLPEHKRPSAPIDFSQIDPGKPESILKMTKKGKTLMMFVTVSGNPTEKETEEITSLWQGSLFNANYDVQR